MIRRAILALARRRFPGQDEATRWTVRRAEVPDGCDALVLLTLEELAINELRETFHHWVSTLRLPVCGGELGEPLKHMPARELTRQDGHGSHAVATALVGEAFDLWERTRAGLEDALTARGKQLSSDLSRQLEADREQALANATERYQSRQGEISALIASSTLARLEREIEDLKAKRKQGRLAYAAYEIDVIDRDIEAKQEELKRRQRHYEEVREELTRERERIVAELIPKRYSMRGSAQVLPVAIEIVLPEEIS
jgi:hypothetical protein